MGNIIMGLIILIVISFAIQRLMPVKGVSQIDADGLKQKLKNRKQHQFIDVRTPPEFNADRIKVFKNIPLSHIKERQQELSKDKEVVLICRSGSRSNRAARILKKSGYTKLANVRREMMGWKK